MPVLVTAALTSEGDGTSITRSLRQLESTGVRGMDARFARRAGVAVGVILVVLLAVLIVVPVGGSTSHHATNSSDFDLVWSQTDMNGFPLSPEWRWQLTHAGAPSPQECTLKIFVTPPLSCTTQTTHGDDAYSCTLPGAGTKVNGISGHVNWQAATYDGQLFWDSKSSYYEDDDYNFRLRLPNDNGLTFPNLEPGGGGHSGLEFDSDETVDHWGKDINDTTYFWPRFRAAVDNNNGTANQLIDGHYAIVTGLLGLDMSHSGTSELHPVYAMAIQIDSGRTYQDWAIFLRNWGDEGWCASHQWYLNLPNDRFTFALPWQSRLPSPAVRPTPTAHFLTTDVTGKAEGPDFTYVPGQKVLVSFKLPPPSLIGLYPNLPAIFGVLRLSWGVSMIPAAPLGTSSIPRERDTPEAKLQTAISKLPPSVQKQMLTQLPLATKSKLRPIRPDLQPRTVTTLKAIPVPAKPPAVVERPDPAKVKLDAQRVRLICQAYKSNVPGLKGFCR